MHLYNLMSKADRARLVMLEFGQCTVRYNLPGARKVSLLFPWTPEFVQQAKKISESECLLGEGAVAELRSSPNLMRGAIYQAFYLDRFRRAAPQLAAGPLDLSAETAGQDQGRVQLYVALRRFGECVVRAAPAESRAVLLAPIGTKEEAAAYQALAPNLGPCLQQGQSVTFSKSMLGGLIAEVAYRLSTQAPSASVAGKY